MFMPTRFDFEQINSELLNACKTDLFRLYDQKAVKAGNLCYQTLDILFDDQNTNLSPCWKVLKDTFELSVRVFIKKQFLSKAWCFASFPKQKNLQWHWHTHPNAEYSAVMYISLPKDFNGNHAFTTEFMQPDGKSLFLEPKLGSWFVFPGDAVHRNGFWDHENMTDVRLCVAATALKDSVKF